MIRINRETDYGVMILSLVAMDPGRRYNATVLAEQLGLSQPMVSKILKHLAKAGLVESFRGAKGGYGLVGEPENITVADIIAALEGPIALTDCVEGGTNVCQYHGHCVISSNWNRINRVVQKALEAISLKDMTRPLNELGKVGPTEAHVSLPSLTR